MAGGLSAELHERVTRLEDLIGLPQEGEEADSISVRIEGLRVQLESIRMLIEEKVNTTNEKIDGVDKDMGILADLQ